MVVTAAPQLHHEKSLAHFYDVYPNAEEAEFITRHNAQEYL
jgi:hypothetical protein